MHLEKENSRTKNAAVPEPEVRAALERILESAEFARAKRVGEFLRFATEEVLAGRGTRLKAFSIAREVYGRDESFDPRSDTIVRVEAGRLRSRLKAYYDSEGRNDPVRIEMPKGGYSPTFQWKDAVEPSSRAPEARREPGPATRTFQNPRYLIGGLVLAMMSILAAWVLFDRSEEAAVSANGTSDERQSRAATPLLAVLPLATLSKDPFEDRLAAGLVEAIITDLTKLSGLSTMAHASLLNLQPEEVNLGAIGEQFGATHALRGSLERDGDQIRINVQLIDIRKNATIWADRFDGEVGDPLALQDALANRIVNFLAVEVSPEERALLERHHTSSPEAFALYRHALVLMMPPNERDRIITARHMFQRVIDIDPTFAGGYAGMGFSHAATILFAVADGSRPELEQAMNMALKAIEIDPQFGMGYVTLAFAYALSGRTDEALYNARQAVAVQPGDAFTQFVYGLSLTLSGRPAEAVTPLSEALRLDPVEARTPYRNVLGIAHYALGDYETAAALFDENVDLRGPTGPHMAPFRAASYVALGKENEAHSIIQDLVRQYPKFPVEDWVAKWLRDAGDLASTMEVLYRLGLPRNGD